MATQRKACVVYTEGLKGAVPTVTEELQKKGFDVCLSAADLEIAEAAQAGHLENVNAEVKECIANAEICIFLIPQKAPESITGAAECARASGGKIIAVVEDVKSIPQIFDELATALVCVGSPQLPEALGGEEIWEAPKQSPEGRKIARVKCQ
ncbi:hypothetical protein SB816_04460 [Achromobacter sp. SIMBA_011]|uniref:hypothetical protein n=1 Tax=Achromobacter TaxID=222 RepID=UPI0022B8FE57|nr:hypothetical protein [Achromobacter dolens]MCZ8408436.1 hypothetical protein [Achromobacter dolens]